MHGVAQDRRNKNEDETPEWFHDGPTSQHDTIELRGFDEERDKAKSARAAALAAKKDAGHKEARPAPANGHRKTLDDASVNIPFGFCSDGSLVDLQWIWD